jgi:hypothetical protein
MLPSMMPSPPPRVLLVWALAAGLLGLSMAGCVRLLEPRTSDATYYLLGERAAPSAASPQAPSPADTAGLRVGLRKPRLASYLDATRIVTRRGPHQVQFSEFHRWGEELDRGIGRTVAARLAARPEIRAVEVVPWSPGASFDYVVELHVLRFEGVGPPPDPEADEDAPPPDGHAQVVVEWTVLRPGTDAVLARQTTRHRAATWPVGNYPALVARLGAGLGTLVEDVAAQLSRLNAS